MFMALHFQILITLIKLGVIANVTCLIYHSLSQKKASNLLSDDPFVLSSINRMALYYTKVMERIQSKGDSFVTTEVDRLERMMGKA